MSAEPAHRSTMTRAELVQAGAAAAAVVAIPTVGRSLVPGLHAALAPARPATAPPLRHATYLPLVGQAFEVTHIDGSRVRLQLLEVRAHDQSGESFSLFFQGGTRTELQSAVHTIEHPGLGSVDLLLGPVGRPVGKRQFEAVVNRTRR
jgi:hypothetical protein